jgi:uncharacterized OsmC-like protein
MKSTPTTIDHRSAQSTVVRRQAPLRAAYAQAPQSARIVKRATTVATAPSDALHGSVALPYDGVCWRYGIDRAIGGLHDAPNPGEMLCAALAACADASIRMLADALGIGLLHLAVEVTGEVDVRGCLAIDRNVPVGFQALSCEVDIAVAPETSAAALTTLLERSERACINLATLRSGVPVELRHRVRHATE